jgi:hypothetical protein
VLEVAERRHQLGLPLQSAGDGDESGEDKGQ